MDEATRVQLALLKQLHAQGVLSEKQYRVQVAALQGGATTFDQREQQVQQQVNVAGDYILQQAAEPGASPEALRRAYLHRLALRTRGLPLAGIDPKATGDRSGGDLQLAAVYTGLRTERRAGDAGALGLQAGGRERPDEEARRLSAVEVLDREKYLVLLGEPGSGKTTFVHFVALCLAGQNLGEPHANLAALTEPLPDERRERPARDDEKPQPQPWHHGALLPVIVTLRDFVARGLPEPGQRAPRHALWNSIVAELGHPEYVPHLKQELLERGGLLLLDGLDEVPEAHRRREQIKAVVQAFVEDFHQCRFLVTSRTYAYQRQDWKLPGFAEVVLAPFTPAQIARFVERWYAHVGALRSWDADHARGQAVLLRTAIERSERLSELAARPLLLTLMASLHAWRGGSLPEKREELYADAVDLLLEQWEGRKVVLDAAGQSLVQQTSLAEWLKVDRAVVRAELNRLAFAAHRDQPELKGTADIAQEPLVNALMTVARNPHANPVELEEYLCHRAGLLVARGTGVYTFPHRTFQEYLAACHLTDHGFPRQLANLLQADPQRWREAVLLAGAKAVRGTAAAAWNLAEALCYRDPPAEGCPGQEGPECWGALLAAQVLLENEGPRLQQVDKWDAPKLERIRLWQQAIVERGWLPPVDRLLAGNALAALGDDRDLDALVEVPAGPFRMGDDQDREARPQYEVTLTAFRIGRYPVTVGQFRVFVEESGYRPGYPDCLRGTANHPVVNVTWHEARAYCQWLTGVWRAVGRIGAAEEARLPSEAEWEKAARGTDGRAFPWGDEWDALKCNASETGLGGTSPVGMFPGGASPCGCLDMAGNVWEWTGSLWGKDWGRPDFRYPYRADDGREDLQASDEIARVLRGGSFFDGQFYARCAFRLGDLPGYRRWFHGGYLGFRVVVSHLRSAL